MDEDSEQLVILTDHYLERIAVAAERIAAALEAQNASTAGLTSMFGALAEPPSPGSVTGGLPRG